jgi:hypothetical protein
MRIAPSSRLDALKVNPAYRAIQDVTEGGYVEPFEM